ncbi:mediator complex cyclin subunit Srb11 [Schizosaccharomyces osmophilus]|uniref:Mediator complex cyclin subunit Srb11 n=1 Tax=Schizosaccharomyces osmophilus TaxID=2545709 RepID=A0AAF0AWD1_9SCHI|nr:mediator complex cyclin subunit Srb11 [Schizosaccharomyces osmophilus]WBW72814.1 mediator complex cyclin subunit Srb11 [Schizosaccharomyces osmophilus]
MSGNYWSSSQLLQFYLPGKHKLSETNAFSEESIVHWKRIQEIGDKIGLNQRVLATASVLLKRYFLKKEEKIEYTLEQYVSACVYLACKVEESPVHIRTICNEANVLWSSSLPIDRSQVAELEFEIISVLEAYLIVYHPYPTLEQIFRDGLITKTQLQLAWNIVNDSYATDLCLLVHPHQIAYAALILSCCDDEHTMNRLVDILKASDPLKIVLSIQALLSIYYQDERG